MATRSPKAFKPNQAAENQFARSLRKVARHSAHIVEAHVDGHRIRNSSEMTKALHDYSKLIEPWARNQAGKMILKAAQKNKRAFNAQSKKIARLLKSNINEAETNIGVPVKELLNTQVELITSIPRYLGERAQGLALEAAMNGTRADEVAKELINTRQVGESKAMLIARTEVAKANAAITEVRAKSAGAKGYIWRTTMDGAERDSHKKMNRKYVEYAKEPVLSDGTKGHAGTFPNCRCFQDPVFDED